MKCNRSNYQNKMVKMDRVLDECEADVSCITRSFNNNYAQTFTSICTCIPIC